MLSFTFGSLLGPPTGSCDVKVVQDSPFRHLVAHQVACADVPAFDMLLPRGAVTCRRMSVMTLYRRGGFSQRKQSKNASSMSPSSRYLIPCKRRHTVTRSNLASCRPRKIVVSGSSSTLGMGDRYLRVRSLTLYKVIDLLNFLCLPDELGHLAGPRFLRPGELGYQVVGLFDVFGNPSGLEVGHASWLRQQLVERLATLVPG